MCYYVVAAFVERQMRSVAVVIWLVLLSGTSVAAEITEFPGLVRETLQLEVSGPTGFKKNLEAMIIRPDGTGPYPLALISHGSNRDRATFPQERPQTYTSPALVFAQRGYASVVLMRSGFGRSTGVYAASTGSCENRDYLASSKTAAADVVGALSVLQKEPWVDPTRVILIGHSTGGLTDIAAAASNPSGILGVISFAGVNGSSRPDFVCHPDGLIDVNRTFGQTAHIPSLWVYADNDHFVDPGLAKRMFGAYTAAGAPASFFNAPAFGSDGHYLIFSPDALWWPAVATFLGSLHLPTEVTIPLPATPRLQPPTSLADTGRAAFETYLHNHSYEKAFAVATGAPTRWVHWSWVSGQRSKTDAAKMALMNCQKLAEKCEVYAIGDRLAVASQGLQ